MKTENLGVCRKHFQSAFYKYRKGHSTLNIGVTA